MMSHHENRTYPCGVCCAIFRRATDLEKHRLVHIRNGNTVPEIGFQPLLTPDAKRDLLLQPQPQHISMSEALQDFQTNPETVVVEHEGPMERNPQELGGSDVDPTDEESCIEVD